jgi:hypothetical protein
MELQARQGILEFQVIYDIPIDNNIFLWDFQT